jgi:hypothetical protein
MDQKPSFLWALLVGGFFAALQALLLTLNIGGTKPVVTAVDYVIYFVTGTLIGVGLVYFLRRSGSRGVAQAVWIGFLASLPFALFGMIFGGMIGAFGVFMLSLSPAMFITGVGYLIGRTFARK